MPFLHEVRVNLSYFQDVCPTTTPGFLDYVKLPGGGGLVAVCTWNNLRNQYSAPRVDKKQTRIRVTRNGHGSSEEWRVGLALNDVAGSPPHFTCSSPYTHWHVHGLLYGWLAGLLFNFSEPSSATVPSPTITLPFMAQRGRTFRILGHFR